MAAFLAKKYTTTQFQLKRGSVLIQILKQKQYEPLFLGEQIFTIFLGVRGFLDDLGSKNSNKISKIEYFWYTLLEFNFPGLVLKIILKDSLLNKNFGKLF